MEGDRDIQLLTANTVIFQSTPSAWRETAAYARKMPEWYISIHSLRMEGDSVRTRIRRRMIHFNPLPPHGGRHETISQSHISIRISIHSLRMEGDIRIVKTYVI